jgi:hypothetical protein
MLGYNSATCFGLNAGPTSGWSLSQIFVFMDATLFNVYNFQARHLRCVEMLKL